MNKELKSLLFISTGLFLSFVLIFNLYTYNATRFIPQASKTSQILNQNRLRAPNIHRSSENWTYPKIDNDPIELVAVKQAKRILVINSNKRQVIYIIHAQINLPAQKNSFRLLHARGQQIYHINGSQQAIAKNWLGINDGNYIETPVTDMSNHQVSRNLRKAPKIENTIQVSTPDAKWLQTLPENTPLIVKEDY